jgi:hypothetical protein
MAMGSIERTDDPNGAPAKLNEGAAPVGRRDFGLAEQIARVEQAALDWGVHVDALEGQFVRALLKAVEETGRTNLAVLGDLEGLIEKTRRAGEGERRRVGLLVEASANALAMAREATESAATASARAEQEIEKSVVRIAREMSQKLLDESQRWLVLKQTERNRRDARRVSICVASAAMAVFIAGYATAQWWSSSESATRQAVFDAVDRCWLAPFMVRTAEGQTIETCRLGDLTPKRPG